MKKKIFSLQYKMTLLILALAVIPIAVVGTISYRQSIKIVEEQTMKSNLNTVEQTADNIDEVFKSMDALAMEMWRDDDFMECLMMKSNGQNPVYETLTAQQRINHYIVFKENVYSVYIKAYNGLEFDTMSAQNEIDKDVEQELVRLQGKYVIIQDEITDYDGTVQKVFSLLRVLKHPKDLARDLAIIKINILEKDISNIYGANLLSQGSEIFIIDAQKNILSALDQAQIGKKLEEDIHGSREMSGYAVREIRGEKSMCTTVPLQQPGWELVNIIPLKELTRDSRAIRQVMIVVILISIVCCLLAIVFFTTKVLKPLKELGKSMKNLEHENFQTILPEQGNDEVALVCQSFNKMSRKLNELINEVYAGRLKQKEAELRVLHEQINPHFLYNTLNTIYWMCKIEHAKESALLVDSLSKLFRLSLNSGKEITTVEKEVEYLRHYIVIQKKRYEENIRFELEVDEDTLGCLTVKLTLQPLVENAIYHGIEKKGAEGTIRIRIFKDGKFLYFKVSDNGAGAEEEELNALLGESREGGSGFAIRNVNDRIRLHFGEEYGLRFKSCPEMGTTVTVKQPVEVEIV